MADDLYSILNVAKDASTQDIKKAFRQLARECHPDTAGDDPVKLARFKQIREAYEVLSDPVQRARYDRRGERKTGPFLGSSWSRFQQGAADPAAKPPPTDLDLEDLLTSFNPSDFGFGGRPSGRPNPSPRPPPRSSPGRDIHLTVDVPEDVAATGGIVTVQYRRLRRADDGSSLTPYEEIHDLRVPPATGRGTELRVRGMGDAGTAGGPYGELVCTVRIVAPVRAGRMKMPRGVDFDPSEIGSHPWEQDFDRLRQPESGRPSESRPQESRAEWHRAREGSGRSTEGRATEGRATEGRATEGRSTESGGWTTEGGRRETENPRPAEPRNEEVQKVDIGITDAILGGRVQVQTPGGTVRITIPSGTDSGTRMRLRGKGRPGPDGAPADLYVELRIVVPRNLDEESRRLIERFGELNPLE